VILFYCSTLFDTNPAVREHMRELATLPQLLHTHTFSRSELCDAMDKNFDLRCAMLGAGVGAVNVEMVSVARSLGFAAKQVRLFGCLVCFFVITL
jgi:hypothetical protein